MASPRSDDPLDRLLTRRLKSAAAGAGEACPDAELLSAFVDGGLDAVERGLIERHVSSCSRCAQVLAMTEVSAAALSHSDAGWNWSSWRAWRWAAPFVTAAIVVGVWLAASKPGTQPASLREIIDKAADVGATRESAPAVSPPVNQVPRARDDVDERLNNPPSPALATRPPAGLDAPSTAPADRKDQRLTEGTLPPAAEDASRLRRRLAEADRTVKEEAAPATTMRAAPRQAGELGAVLVPTPDRNVLWRGRDNAIEQSGDGGLTWRPERTVSGTIVGGSAPTPEVVWFAVNNPNGLVLRRTPAGWSGTATFDAAIVAIRATSTTQATVEVIGGRQFDTTDGGATWKPR